MFKKPAAREERPEEREGTGLFHNNLACRAEAIGLPQEVGKLHLGRERQRGDGRATVDGPRGPRDARGTYRVQQQREAIGWIAAVELS